MLKTTLETTERRSTKQRSLILDVVQHSHAHPDAEEVYRIARRKITSLSLGTVYRNLRVLVNEGLIREVQSAGKVVRYDGMLEAHSHFQCTSCGRIIDLPTLPKFDAPKSPQLKGCEVQDFKLDLFGLCPDCRTARKA